MRTLKAPSSLFGFAQRESSKETETSEEKALLMPRAWLMQTRRSRRFPRRSLGSSTSSYGPSSSSEMRLPSGLHGSIRTDMIPSCAVSK